MMNSTSPRRRRFSIALLVIVSIVAVATLLFGALGVIVWNADRESKFQRLRIRLATNADALSTGLSLPIWNFDRAQIDEVLKSIMNDEDVYGVIVRLSDVNRTVRGFVRDATWRPAPTDHDFGVEGLLVE